MTGTGRWRVVATVLAIPAALIVLAGVAIIVIFFVSTQDKNGDDVARGTVEHVAGALEADLRGAYDLTDAETVAAEMFRSRTATVEPLTWSGAFGSAEPITIQARISATVEASGSGAIFSSYTSAGSAEKCYRYTVPGFREATSEEVSCEGIPEPLDPPRSSRPELPSDAAERVESVLVAAAGSDPTDALRAEFPGSAMTVEVEETSAGEVVAAVGVTPGTDCVLRVVSPTGEVTAPSFDPIWLEPGETGCSTRLYTAPPL